MFFPDPPRPAGCDAQDGPRQADTQAGPPQADALAGPPAADAPPAPPEAAAPPYRALVEALDALAAAGVLSLRQRRDAEWPCWSAVHGFAELALRGPLRGRERDNLHRLASATVDAIIAGVAS